jgi:dolichol kinase
VDAHRLLLGLRKSGDRRSVARRDLDAHPATTLPQKRTEYSYADWRPMEGNDVPGSSEGPDDDATLDTLVARTEGTQMWRRLFHAMNGTVTAVLIVGLDLSRTVAVGLFGALFMVLLGWDALRLTNPRANEWFFRMFNRLASPRESRKIASSTWYTLGIVVAVWLFPQPAAISGILVLAWADPAASYLGRRWGKRPFMGGTVEGTAVFIVVTLAVLTVRHSLAVAVPAALLIVLVERLSWPLDDNLAVPPVCAGIVTGLELLLRG